MVTVNREYYFHMLLQHKVILQEITGPPIMKIKSY